MTAFQNAINYFLKHKVIWFYDRVGIFGIKTMCSSNDFPKYIIEGLGRVNYYDKDRKHINDEYKQE